MFSADGLKPDSEKVDYLNNMPTPQNVNELRSLLGMANYSSRFINNFASIVAPLRALEQKDGECFKVVTYISRALTPVESRYWL